MTANAAMFRRRVSPTGGVLAFVAALMIALAIGALLALNQIVALAAVALMALPLALFAPRMLFWIVVVGSLGVIGLLELYLPALQGARNIVPFLAALFLCSVLVRRAGQSVPPAGVGAPIVWAVVCFLAVGAASTVLNWQGVVAAIPGVKNYFQAWGLLLGLLSMAYWPGLERRVAKAMLALAVIQLPFALHQFLFVVPRRLDLGGGVVAVDVVSGTLGGTATGGGQNAFLALVLSVVAGVIVALWRNGVVRLRTMALLLPWVLLPLLLNSSRASVVYALVVFVFIFRKEILHRKMRFVAGGLAMALLGSALMLSYMALDKRQWGNRFPGVGDMVKHVLTTNTAENEGYGALALNRTTALTFWAREARHYPTAQVLLGHGLSSAKEGDGRVLDTSHNLASSRYGGMGIGLTAASSLLWDLGILGFLACLALPIAGYVTAGRLGQLHADSPFHAGLFEGLQAACLLVALSFFHKSPLTFHLGYQVFFCLLVGLLGYCGRHSPHLAGSSAPARAPRRAGGRALSPSVIEA